MKYCFIILILLFYGGLVGQKIKYDSTFLYVPNNQSFEYVLNDFIEHEKQYDYYDSTCTFSIYFNVSDSSTLFILVSGCNSERTKETLSNADYLKKINDSDYFLKYKDHLFCMRMNTERKTIDTNLVRKTEEIYQFHYLINTGKIINQITATIEDDTYMETTWTYIFQNKKMHEFSKISRNYGKIKDIYPIRVQSVNGYSWNIILNSPQIK